VKRYVITPRASADLDEIWNYIARDNLTAADRVEEKLFAAMAKLAEMPGLGHTRRDVTDPRYRFWRVYSYLIAYRLDTDPLQIIRVISGRRDIARLF